MTTRVPLLPSSSAPAVVRLADLPDRTAAVVMTLDESCQGYGRRRLMDLGLTEGTIVRPVLRTFAGDPRAYRLRGTTVALRREQAVHVVVRPIVEGTDVDEGGRS